MDGGLGLPDGFYDKYCKKIRFAGKTNPAVKRVAALIANTRPNPDRLFVAEGIWAFNMALSAGLDFVSFFYAPECAYSPEALNLAGRAASAADYINILSKKVFLTISERDEPDGLLAVCRLPRSDVKDIPLGNAMVVVLDGLEIPGNIGTILRSADASGADAVLVCGRKARLTHPKLIKGSMGAAFTVPVVEFPTATECREWLLANGFSIFLADTRAEKGFYDYDYHGNCAVVMGGERYGLSREWYGEGANLLSIPMLGKCDSLNVAIAATVILYEMRLKKNNLRQGKV